ncbi:DUF4355 domain-containing protein [Enterococcus sp. 2201sp1_2201st1_B8_2201SCRN_220225]|uniref:DUF4355 domain-containing protein n=1 Tax=unclassified Enterococcus TaxID=2608891 RepID=UPI0034A20B0F
MKKRFLMPLNLQFFAEAGADGGTDNSGQDQGQNGADNGGQEQGKTFSRDEVAKMIAAEKSKARTAWEKEQEAKEAEAKKLAKLNGEEKLQHQLEQKEAEIAELKRSQALSEMTKEASKMLTEASLPHDEELLALIVSDDAEATKKAVGIVTAYVSKIKKESARQEVPNVGGKFSTDKTFKSTVAELAKKNRIVK